MKIVTLAALAASFAARYPNAAAAGTVESLQAGAAEPGTVGKLEAGAVRGFAANAGKLQFVKALTHFYVEGELIQEGDFVQVTEPDAKMLRNAGRAEFASDEEIAAAQKGSKGKA